jgi:hypothetical protein
VYLTYLDDGGKGNIKVFGGVVVTEEEFTRLELMSAMIVYRLFSADEQRQAFTEFHATDLFAGTGAFKGIEEPARHRALLELVQLRSMVGLPYIYSAVDVQELKKGPLRSASWVDTAFFMTACAVDDFLVAQAKFALDTWLQQLQDSSVGRRMPPLRPLSLMVVDEPEQLADKGRIRDSFRLIRQPISRALKPQSPGANVFNLTNRLQAPVDEVFFGHSADSIGLQMADACNWVMWRRLVGEPEDDFFRELMRGPVICAKPEPEWSTYRHLFKSHEDALTAGASLVSEPPRPS